MLWKWMKRIGLGLLCLVAVALLGGASYQFIATQIDASRHPPIGKMVDVGGYRMHLHSMGTGGPAVILDTGLGCPSPDWGLVQPEIAQFTQVVSYDRAGTGWSECSPSPRTSQNIVHELHTLLQNAAIPKPYILVGHSFGGNNVQLYAATYPDEVLGIVLVDSCHEEQLRRLVPNPFAEQGKWRSNPQAVYLMSLFGVMRFFSEREAKAMISFLPTAMQKSLLALFLTTKHLRTVAAEDRALEESLKQLEDADRSLIKDKPCFVLTAGLGTDLSAWGIADEYQEAMDQMQVVWNTLQRELAAKFTRSHHLIAEKSDHMIPWHQPELVVHAVKELIQETRVEN